MKQISFQDVYQPSVAASFTIGEQAQTPDGRKWVYVRAKEALSAGNAVVPIANVDVDTVSSSTDANGNIIYITEASAGWTVGAYADSWIVVNDGTGVGQTAKVRANTTDTLILYPEFALSTALAVADSDITIVSPFQVDKSAVTSLVQNAIGVTQVAFTDEYYGFVLYEGVGAVVAGDTLTVGEYFSTGDDTEGQVKAIANGETIDDVQLIGRALVANAAADQSALAFINIT